MKNCVNYFVLAAIGLFCSNAFAGITFLNHFNDTNSFNINEANGDYAAGDSTAVTNGNPGWTTGFFASSLPGNNALQITSTGNYVQFEAKGGDVNYTSGTSGGITVGFWAKVNHGAGTYGAGLFRIGNPTLSDDYFRVRLYDPRSMAYFRDGSSTVQTPLTATYEAADWHYYAATVDLTNAKLTYYIFNSDGSIFSTKDVVLTVTGWNVKDSASSVLQFGTEMTGSTTSIVIDEIVVDDTVLAVGDIQSRVDSMVAGNQIQVPEPTTMVCLVIGGMIFCRLRRNK